MFLKRKVQGYLWEAASFLYHERPTSRRAAAPSFICWFIFSYQFHIDHPRNSAQPERSFPKDIQQTTHWGGSCYCSFMRNVQSCYHRGVHSIVRRLRTNPLEKSTCVFFSFCFLPPRLGFLQINRKRMSLTGDLLKHSNWNCDLEVAGELQRRRTGWAGSGSGQRYRDRDRQRVWTWCTRHSGSRRRSDVVQCRD